MTADELSEQTQVVRTPSYQEAFKHLTRQSKIVSRATGRYAATSFDQLLVCPRFSFAGVA